MDATVWQSKELVKKWLSGVRSAIPMQRERLDVMLRLLQANGRPIERFLDIGCGDGVLGAAVLTRWPAAHGVFLDFSEAMLTAARDKLTDGGHDFLLVDYGDPVWTARVTPHAPYDAIVSGFSIHHQHDARKRQIYAEVFDLLAPGGIFINIEHVASATPWGETLFNEEFIDALFAYHQTSGSMQTRQAVADEFYNRPDKVANILAPLETQLAWLREIGFTDVDCYSKHFELCLFGGRKSA
jgi:tRNA (cmo5U34)-methyltransferase